MDEQLASHISGLAFKLSLSNEEQEELAKDFDAPKPPEQPLKQPLLINYNDDLTRRLNHVKPIDGFDPMKAELRMQAFEPISDLCHVPRQSSKVAKERSARLQELLTQISISELSIHGKL